MDSKARSKALIAKVRHLFRRENLPRSRAARVALGVGLSVGGITGIVLPVLGLWMLPLGIAVLSVDSPAVRRFARKTKVKWGNWRGRRTSRA
jgi:hypothetical protein